MARIRSVKPELRDSRLVATWPFEVRYFWVLLFGYLDDSGRGHDMPKRIAGDCFPHDDITAEHIDQWLDLMSRGIDGQPGPVCRYKVAGSRYVHSVNWREHQRPNRPTPSRIPPCPLHESLTESLHETSLPGAAEQGSSGAEEQQHAAHEPLTAMPEGADAAMRIVIDATHATPELAARVVTAIHTARKPRNLPGLVHRIIDAGELGEWIQRAQAAQRPAGSSSRASPRDRAETERLAIANCRQCDDTGRIRGRPCPHDQHIAERTGRGAQAARARLKQSSAKEGP